MIYPVITWQGNFCHSTTVEIHHLWHNRGNSYILMKLVCTDAFRVRHVSASARIHGRVSADTLVGIIKHVIRINFGLLNSELHDTCICTLYIQLCCMITLFLGCVRLWRGKTRVYNTWSKVRNLLPEKVNWQHNKWQLSTIDLEELSTQIETKLLNN